MHDAGTKYEIKTDTIAARTGNVCVELAKIKGDTPDYARGWLNYSQADRFIFYLFDYTTARIDRNEIIHFTETREANDALLAYCPIP